VTVTRVTWHDGRFAGPDEPRLRLDDPGYLLGDGVFATMRAYRGVCFRAALHLAELARGAVIFGIASPVEPVRLEAVCHEAAARTGAADAYVRVTLTRGPVLSVLARPLEAPGEEDYVRGVAAVTVTWRRAPPACGDPTVKSTSYAAPLLARREAETRGAREGLQLGIAGELACGAMSNVFVVVGDALLTPSLASGCRDGVTRRTVLALATRAGLEAREVRLEPSVLARADEAFFTSTRFECLPLASLDGAHVGRGTYPRAAALRHLLRGEALAPR
jgi:branched-subunit amino acid aminotransferase/4-amino-4-deoxychorismate lyase